ncbi:MAG: NAD(P)-binding protein [Planctomycetota bacterium]
MPIDHGVGPVPHTIGGSEAGYARWNEFREHGLRAYARRRNDAARPDGVSRLSPYLHYGMVSPFRIAREAAEDGAEKFLDELLIWRELAHNFCFHARDPERLGALPDWAQTTLRQHANDERDELFSWEQLARGETGDELWDAAQASLRIHGELHNNVRMTWGKALTGWTRDPATALRMLIDLNHRYALDGRDPNSYGGLLWCLGLFDRPFPPARPVEGELRARPTASHAERIDLERYRSITFRPARTDRLSVGIVGAGLAGLTAARTLHDHAIDVRVYERAPTPGGRLGAARGADTGAQYFTARDPRFRRYVDAWVERGVVAEWPLRLAVVGGGSVRSKPSAETRYVGTPDMAAVARHLAHDIDVRYGVEINSIGDVGRFELAGTRHDVVLLALPPADAAALLPVDAPLRTTAAAVVMDPSWAVTAVFDGPLPLDFDGAFVEDSPLTWIARDSAKPGRGDEETWMLHGTTEHGLLEAFFAAVGLEPVEPLSTDRTAWPHAIAPDPLEVECLWDAERRLGVGGDWCARSRVEGAFLSGQALAGSVLRLPCATEAKQLDLI